VGLIADPCLSSSQLRLRDLISDVSEACYYAGWMSDPEFEVWRLLTEGGRWGHGRADELAPILREVATESERQRVWIVWSDRAGCDNEPIDLELWKARYASWRRKHAGTDR
jgi:hypothetical protein